MKRREALMVLGAIPFSSSPGPKQNPSRSILMKKEVKTGQAPQAIGPYSQAIVANGFVFCSGQIPLVPETGAVIEGGIEEQTRRVLQNLSAVLLAAGSSLDQAVKCTVFLQDMNDFAAMNKVYAEFFKVPAPARAAVQIARLPKDVKVEIEAVAIIS